MAVGMRMRDFLKLYFPQVQLPCTISCDCHDIFTAYLSDASLYSSKHVDINAFF